MITLPPGSKFYNQKRFFGIEYYYRRTSWKYNNEFILKFLCFQRFLV